MFSIVGWSFINTYTYLRYALSNVFQSCMFPSNKSITIDRSWSIQFPRPPSPHSLQLLPLSPKLCFLVVGHFRIANTKAETSSFSLRTLSNWNFKKGTKSHMDHWCTMNKDSFIQTNQTRRAGSSNTSLNQSSNVCEGGLCMHICGLWKPNWWWNTDVTGWKGLPLHKENDSSSFPSKQSCFEPLTVDFRSLKAS